MYSESERPWFTWAFVSTLLVCVVIYALWGWKVVEQGWGQAGGTPFIMTLIPTVVVLVFLIWSSWTYFIHTDGFGLQFGFNGWNKRFDYSDIIEAKRVDIRWTHWGGFGWRWRLGRIAYIVRNGRGVQIATNHSNRSYTFNCRDCDALLTALGRAGVPITSPATVAQAGERVVKECT